VGAAISHKIMGVVIVKHCSKASCLTAVLDYQVCSSPLGRCRYQLALLPTALGRLQGNVQSQISFAVTLQVNSDLSGTCSVAMVTN